METLLTLYATKKLIACKTVLIIIVYNVLTYTICNSNDKQTITFLYIEQSNLSNQFITKTDHYTRNIFFTETDKIQGEFPASIFRRVTVTSIYKARLTYFQDMIFSDICHSVELCRNDKVTLKIKDLCVTCLLLKVTLSLRRLQRVQV